MDNFSTKYPIKVAYILNPDPVFFNELDYKLIDHLKEMGAEVTTCNLEKLHIQMTSSGVQIFHDNIPLDVDGMLCYGYMSANHQQQYIYMVSAFENMKKVCLHSENTSRILDNKYLQGLHYAKAGIPIPDTFIGFELPAVRHIYKSNIQDRSVIKSLSDYGGDGVKLSKHPDEGVTTTVKLLWANQQTLTQKFVPDVWGKSIRVLLIKGKAFAFAEYNDESKDFRSNVSYHDNFKLLPILDEKLCAKYAEVAEKAALSIDPEITIGGVDLLDSKTKGVVVLEINCWPDLYDIEETTKKPIFKAFSKTFCEKVYNNKLKNQK